MRAEVIGIRKTLIRCWRSLQYARIPLEAAGPVMERVGEQAEMCIAVPAQLALEIHPRVRLCTAKRGLCGPVPLVGILSHPQLPVGCFDEVREMPDEAAGDAAISHAVIEDE